MPEQKANTMSFSQTQLEALQTALTQGERRVSFGDKTVEYRSVDELRQAIREVTPALERLNMATQKALHAGIQ